MTLTDALPAGSELQLFRHALRWKRYWTSRIELPAGDILEVGAGIGGSTPYLCRQRSGTWTCLEPDGDLFDVLSARIASGELPSHCRARRGTTEDLRPDERFDALIHADVLEHIEDDRAEVRRAVAHLHPGGLLVVLVPAVPWLYSPFDAAVGHHRRYDRASLRALTVEGLTLTTLESLDAAGLLASLGNKLLLRRSLPTEANIATWDRLLVPISRAIDPIIGHAIGRSLLAIWTRH